MNGVAVIEKVLQSPLLSPGLTLVPPDGATDAELAEEEGLLPRPLSEQHRRLLHRWNGIDLEVIRFFGCGQAIEGIGRLSTAQLKPDSGDGLLVVGSDPSGFIYLETSMGRIYSFDTDGGDLDEDAAGLDDFIGRVVFGKDAASFGGEDWLEALRSAGLVH